MDEKYAKEFLLVGGRVVHMVSGYDGIIYRMDPWGVQVWVPERGNERENWTWNMITIRYPRRVRRFPRPFRFARRQVAPQCRCKIGKLEVESVDERKVRCQRCRMLVGNESFPTRILRATERLYEAYLKSESEVQAPPRVNRPENRKARRRSPKRKATRAMGLRHVRRRKEATRNGKRLPTKTKRPEAKPKQRRNRKVPSTRRRRRNPSIPAKGRGKAPKVTRKRRKA